MARRRRWAVDLTPLRISRDFRILWTGSLVSEAGSQIALVAVYVQVYDLTRSTLAVGLIGAVELVPMVLASVFAGPWIDRADRRRVLIAAQVGQAAGSAILLGGALAGQPPLGLVYLGAATVAGCWSVALAARSAMVPNLVPPAELAPALALTQVMWQAALVSGPAIGGLLIGSVGLRWAYGADLASFAVSIAAAALIAPVPVQAAAGGEDGSGWQRFLAGLRYLRGRRVLQTVFAVDLVAMVFGMPRALFPVLAVEQFAGGPEIVGILFASVSLGSLLGALSSGWVGRVRRQGLAVLVAVALWGVGIVVFGAVGDRLVLAAAGLAAAGAADVVSAVFRGTILQQNVPDDLRGRMSAVNILVVTGGPRIGDVEAGVVAALFSPTVSVISGGLACIAGVGVLALAVPEFARYRSRAGVV